MNENLVVFLKKLGIAKHPIYVNKEKCFLYKSKK